ncbi:TLR adapter interacting with SLC15A4 on the lysosome [Amia ocellicauda]|uniref:TLR adapter interacting with SLC15A4 on the lysosome n=1 Tax=Amia ocellicauda TaxID=2972642 RepID=UPI003463E0DE
MLCESFLWTIPYGSDCETQVPSSAKEEKDCGRSDITSVINHALQSTADEVLNEPPLETWKSTGQFENKSPFWNKRPLRKSGSRKAAQYNRQISPVVDIPGQSRSNKETYLVPSSCKSICKDYNDLHIAGDQVMPISSSTVDLTIDSAVELAEGPFLHSSEIPPAMESPRPSPEFAQKRKVDSSCWRVGSAKDKSFLQHCRPLSNSMLNEYLEQKIMDLYKQYMVESMLNSNSPTTILASELILNNVDQITQQLSREQNMETTKAKDMVISCLLRVASGLQSSELSTPQLQISSNVRINC